jgi:RHS repeat-associated protein
MKLYKIITSNNAPIIYDLGASSGFGNITYKSDVGIFSTVPKYNGAISYISNPSQTGTYPGMAPDLINQGQQDIEYNAYDRVATISEFDINSNSNLNQTFIYDANANRVKSIFTNGGIIPRTRYHLGDYELQNEAGIITQLIYVNTPVGLAAIINTTGGISTNNYVYTDHLGSITVVTDELANIIAKQSFDAWGKPRNADDWDCTTNPSIINPTWLWRGYTGHEMMPEFALINMNARLYDYINARMLQPDINLGNSVQGYNRYSYAKNNPLSYIDPDGNEPIIVTIMIGGMIGFA